MSPYYVLLTVSLLDMLSASLIMPQLLNPHALSLGASHITIGVMGALFSASQLISAPVIGSLSDIKGRKPILIACLIVSCVSYIYLGLTTSLFLFILLRVIIGFTKQTQLLTKALTADHVKDSANQTVLYGRIAALSGLGMTVGPIFGGHIVDYYPNYGFTILTIIGGIICFIDLLLIKSLPDMKPTKKDNRPPTPRAISPKLIDSIKTPLKETTNQFYKIDWTVFGDIFLYKLLLTLCTMMFFGSFGLFLVTEHQMRPKNLGFLVSIQGWTSSMCNFCIGYITNLYKNDKDFTQRNLHVFFGLTMSLVGLALAPKIYVFTLLLIPLSIYGSIGRIVSLEMITKRATDDRRGTVIGVANSIESLAGVLTPLMSGLVNQYLGVKYGFYIAASFTGIGVIISYRARTKSLKDKVK